MLIRQIKNALTSFRKIVYVYGTSVLVVAKDRQSELEYFKYILVYKQRFFVFSAG